MKGLFDCLRNRIYREDEDILQQIAANAAVDDSEIEAFEADDEDEEDEWDLGGINVDEIDDADIERVTNEFNMDEGNRAACRLRTIDLKEDNVEYQPETKLNKKVSRDPDMREFVGAGDGSGHDMKTEDVVYNERLTSKSVQSKDYMAKDAIKKGIVDKNHVGKNAISGKRSSSELARLNQGDEYLRKAFGDKRLGEKMGQERLNRGHEFLQGEYAKQKRKQLNQKGEEFKKMWGDQRAKEAFDRLDAKNAPKAPAAKVSKGDVKPINKSVPAAKKGVNWKKGAAIAGGAALAGAAAYGGKKLYDHIKAKRAAKAKEVAVEEGVSLEEAYAFILECEENLFNEGFTLEDIYEEDVYEEDNVELQPETKLNRRISQDPDMRDFVGAGDGSGHDMKTESFDSIMEEVMNEIAVLDEASEIAYEEGLIKRIKAKRAKKAAEVAVEEECSLDEAYEFIFECEQNLLDEGYDIEDIYEEDIYDEDTVRAIGFGNKKRLIKDSQLKKGAAIGALGAAGMGAAAYGAKKFMDNRKIKHAFDEDVYEEDSVELQPETKLNRRISQDPDMRDFVGAGDGSGHDMKTEAAILAYEEGISLEEAMEWLMEDEVYDEGLIKNIKAQRDAKRDYKAAKKAAGKVMDDELDPHYKNYEEKRKDLERRKKELKQASDDLDMEIGGHEDRAMDAYFKAKGDAKRAYKAKKKEIWHGKKEDVVDDAIDKLGRDGNDNGVFPTRVDLQDEVYDEEVYEEGKVWERTKAIAANYPKTSALMTAGASIPVSIYARAERKIKAHENDVLANKVMNKRLKDELNSGNARSKLVIEKEDADECAPKRQQQRPVGNVDAVSVDGIDTDDELMLGVEAVIREIEESLDLDDFDC